MTDRWDMESDDDLLEDEQDTAACPYCQAVIYDDSVQCPRCGMYLEDEAYPSDPPGRLWLRRVVVVMLLIVLLGPAVLMLAMLLQQAAG